VGRFAVHFDNQRREFPLLAVTTVGRHWSNTVMVADSRTPMTWLEIRWTGSAWIWRGSGSVETRGAGRIMPNGWREFSPTGSSSSKSARVHCGDAGTVDLIDPSPPQLVLEDLETRSFLEGATVEDLVEWRPDGVVPVDWQENWRRTLVDGEVAVIRDRPLRVHLPAKVLETLQCELDLRQPNIEVDIHIPTLTATFTAGTRALSVSGEPVRALIPYALRRLDDHAIDGGWLTRQEAFDLWVTLGGNQTSQAARLGWEHGRLRTALVKAGAAHVQSLFEHTRSGNIARTRFAISPLSISLSDG